MNAQPTPFDTIEDDEVKSIVAMPDQEPIAYGDMMRRAGLQGEPATAEGLVNTTFDILRAKPYDSNYQEQDHVWYCVVRPVDSDKLFSVSLGGQAVVEVLDNFARMGINNPLRVTLRFKTGGKYSGYYFFE